jgi:hypothetical protein
MGVVSYVMIARRILSFLFSLSFFFLMFARCIRPFPVAFHSIPNRRSFARSRRATKNYDFPDTYWGNVSESANDMIKGSNLMLIGCCL